MTDLTEKMFAGYISKRNTPTAPPPMQVSLDITEYADDKQNPYVNRALSRRDIYLRNIYQHYTAVTVMVSFHPSSFYSRCSDTIRVN